jgi:hypothetical protein
MDLRQFISQALLDIVGSVEDAQKRTVSGVIVPDDVVEIFQAVESGVSALQGIEFEVTVKADERAGSEAKLSVVAAVIGGSVKGDSGKSGGHVATLKFNIPVRLPTSKREAKPDA